MDNASLFIQTDSTLVSLDKHCYHIAQVLNALGTTREYDDEGWHTVCDWFRVASSIKSVDTLLWPMDESGLWCSPAAEYDDEKHKIYNRVTNDLILFNTIYSGLESLITLLKPLGIKKDGKIKAASKYLETFSANFAPLKYQLSSHAKVIV